MEITHENSMCWPLDTNVYFPSSPICFCVANDWAGLLRREMVTQIPNGMDDMFVIPYHCFSLLDNISVPSDVPAWTNSTGLVCSILVWVTFSSMESELKTKRVFLSLSPQPVNATWANLTKDQCLKYGGRLEGETCGFVPDITLMSFILFFGTYACSMALKQFKTSRFFPTTVSHSACVRMCPLIQPTRARRVRFIVEAQNP